MADSVYLNSRGLYQTVWPIDAKVVQCVTTTINKKMDIPFDVATPTQRKLRGQYQQDKDIVLSSSNNGDLGFNFMFKLTGSGGFANMYVFCELGKPLSFSYEIGGDCFTYPAPITNEVSSITIDKSNSISIKVDFSAVHALKSTPKGSARGVGANSHWTQIITIKKTNKASDDGYYGAFNVEMANAWDETGLAGNLITQLIMAKGGGINFNSFVDIDEHLYAKENGESTNTKTLFKNMYRFESEIKYYYTQDSYLGCADTDKYLLQEDIDWKSTHDFDIRDSYIEMTIEIDGATNSTDNYTGFNPSSPKRLEKIILPTELAQLAPQTAMNDGLVFCGESGSRITGAKYDAEGIALFSFQDSTECVIPDPEYKTFIAKDTRTGQILSGKVISMVKKSGNPQEAVRELSAIREENNKNATLSFEIGEEEVLDSIAWLTGENNDYIKIIVPDEDNTKIITINIGEL